MTIAFGAQVVSAFAERFTPLVQPDVAYQRDPIGWMELALGIDRRTIVWSENPEYEGHRWDGTPDPLKVIAESIAAGHDVGVESGTDTGKTFFAAALTCWFEACWKDSLVITTAPKQDQLTLHMWKEIGIFWPRFAKRFPKAELTQLHIRMLGDVAEKESWSAVGYACGVEADAESATRFQGFHREHMLVHMEEMPGIHKAVTTAIFNTCAGEHNIRVGWGNPDSEQDELHRFCVEPGVVHVRISALDHPNIVCKRTVIPGAVSQRKVDQRREKYREDSRMYQSRVRGISPKESAEALIRWDWCVAAAKRQGQPDMRLGDAALGVDVANSEAGDRAAIAQGQGATLEQVVSFPCPDPVKLAFNVRAWMKAYDVDAYSVGVDSVGVGSGTTGRLKEMDLHVRALNGGSGIDGAGDEVFANLRAAMQWRMARDLQDGLIALPNDEELFRDLCAPMWKTQNGKIIVESKEDLKKRLGRSPDMGDAAVYWNWVRDREPKVSKVKYKRPDEATLIAADQRGEEIPIDPNDEDSDTYGDQLDQG